MAGIAVAAGWDAGIKSRRVQGSRTVTPRATRAMAGLALAVAVVATAGFVPGTVGGWGNGAAGSASAVAGESLAYRVVVVQAGDSLWSIAQRALPGIDPRESVDQLRAFNGMTSTQLHPGQHLLVPPVAG